MLSTTQEPPQQRSLFIGNLALSVKEDELEDRFSKFGKITSVRIPRVHGNNKPRGFAFIEFDNSGDAELAIRGENGKSMHSQKMDIDWCRDTQQDGGMTNNDRDFHGPPHGAPHHPPSNGGFNGNNGNNGNNNNNNNSATQPVRFVHHLDPKTLESLPVMEVEPGKFVKVIPASFMQCMLYF